MIKISAHFSHSSFSILNDVGKIFCRILGCLRFGRELESRVNSPSCMRTFSEHQTVFEIPSNQKNLSKLQSSVSFVHFSCSRHTTKLIRKVKVNFHKHRSKRFQLLKLQQCFWCCSQSFLWFLNVQQKWRFMRTETYLKWPSVSVRYCKLCVEVKFNKLFIILFSTIGNFERFPSIRYACYSEHR